MMRQSAEERSHLLELATKGLVHDGRMDCVAGNGIMSELGAGIERGDGEW